MSTLDEFLQRIERHAGLHRHEYTARTVRYALAALGEVLVEDELVCVRSAVPPELRGAVATHPRNGEASIERFVHTVAREAHLSDSAAREVVGVICAQLAQRLSEGVRARWRRDMPAELAKLFSLDATAEAPPPLDHGAVHPTTPTNTLAVGRPGSTNPLSEAHPERAHAHSIVREENPHEDTKLSSATPKRDD